MYAEKRAKRYVKLFEGVFEKGDFLADVGCGDGRLGESLRDAYGLNIVGFDIIKNPSARIKTIIYDGKNLPLEKNSVDWVLFFSVLHHCDNQYTLLEQAKKIARKGIIIHEGIHTNFFHNTLLILNDFIGNRRKGVPCPFNFHRQELWQDLFKMLGLKIGREKKYSLYKFCYKSQRVFWVLRTH